MLIIYFSHILKSKVVSPLQTLMLICNSLLMSTQARNQKLFRAREVLWSQGTVINFSSTTQEKKPCRAKFWTFFPQILLKLHFKWKIEPNYGHKQGLFFQNQGAFFRFSKKRRGGLPPSPSSCTPTTQVSFISLGGSKALH